MNDAITASVDPKVLAARVKDMYRDVAEKPKAEFHFEMERPASAARHNRIAIVL